MTQPEENVAQRGSTDGRIERAKDAALGPHRGDESSTERISDHRYDDIRGAYFLGHIASNNPNFVDREFTEIEPELARGWRDCTARPCDWEQARAFVGEGYRRGAQRRQRTDRRTVERMEELERRLDERRLEEHGEVL